MLREQIAHLWSQLTSKMAASLALAPRARPELAGAILNEDPIDDVNGKRLTEPYIPSKNERLSDSSLHLSC